MAVKKYTVREGFVVVLKLTKQDGSTYERTYDAGEEAQLDDDQAALHIHKLEFSSQKDRDAALAAEKEAAVHKAAAGLQTGELVNQLVAALSQALQAAQAAQPAPAEA